MSSWGLAEFLFVGTAFLGVTFGFSAQWDHTFAYCSNGDINGTCTCPEGKVLAKSKNQQICFDRIDYCPNGYPGYLGLCTCFEGAESEGSCLKICSNCDDNGWCSSSEKCECNPGYKMSKDNKCEPICESLCPENGICSAPKMCTCNEGYRMSENKEKCEPICSQECPEDAHCSAPEQCECNEGYYKFLTNYCIPKCDYCTYGVCVSPGNCVSFSTPY